jgi:hypothetical protein
LTKLLKVWPKAIDELFSVLLEEFKEKIGKRSEELKK